MGDGLRILHCAPRLAGGGAERQLSYLARHHADAGHQIHIAYLAGSEVPQELQRNNISLHPIRHFSTYDPYILVRLIRLIRAIKPDIIQTWLLQMDVFAGIAAFLTRTPWLLREPSSAANWPASLKSQTRIWTANTSDAVISNSRGGDAYWAHFKPATQRFVVGNALPLDEIAATPPATRETLGLPSAGPIIMYAGRMSEEKNLDTLVRALARVTSVTASTAIMFGDGPLRLPLQQLVDEMGARDRVLLPGKSAGIWSALKSADLFVSISKFEGRPNAILEAITCRCPLVVSDIPAHREFLDDSMAIFVNRYDNPECVSEAILAALENRENTARYSQAAAHQVEGWSVPLVAEQYEQIYATILQRRGTQA